MNLNNNDDNNRSNLKVIIDKNKSLNLFKNMIVSSKYNFESDKLQLYYFLNIKYSRETERKKL